MCSSTRSTATASTIARRTTRSAWACPSASDPRSTQMKIMHMLGLLVLVAVAALLVVGGFGFAGQRGLLAVVSAQVTSSDALRNHMQADMMHDALRGDVIAALLAGAQQDEAGIKE